MKLLISLVLLSINAQGSTIDDLIEATTHRVVFPCESKVTTVSELRKDLDLFDGTVLQLTDMQKDKELNNHKQKELRQRQLCLVDLITGGFYEI